MREHNFNKLPFKEYAFENRKLKIYHPEDGSRWVDTGQLFYALNLGPSPSYFMRLANPGERQKLRHKLYISGDGIRSIADRLGDSAHATRFATFLAWFSALEVPAPVPVPVPVTSEALAPVASTPSRGRRQQMLFINQKGVNDLIIKSTMPRAQEFARFLMHDVRTLELVPLYEARRWLRRYRRYSHCVESKILTH